MNRMAPQKLNRTLANHEILFKHARYSATRASIVQDVQAGQYEKAQKRLKRLYEKCFGICNTDWKFLRALGSVRNGMIASTVLTHGEGKTQDCITTTLLKGHGPIRDLFDANINQLVEAGLIRYPRIRGEKRQRVIYKPYYVLTPEATDCIDVGLVGPQVGDLGESVVHAVGARLYGEYMKRRVARETGRKPTVEYYSDLPLDKHTIDIAIYLPHREKSYGRDLYAVGEVKTALGSDREVLDSMHKMGAVRCEHKHWIAPRRELINEILNVAAVRDWYTLNVVPETLPLETNPNSGIRSTNDRIAESTFSPDVPGSPMATPLTRGFSYMHLYHAVKKSDPALFDAPKVTEARI